MRATKKVDSVGRWKEPVGLEGTGERAVGLDNSSDNSPAETPGRGEGGGDRKPDEFW
jgi:hypothetical protein